MPRLFWQSMREGFRPGETSSPRKGSEVSEEKKDGEKSRKASLALAASFVRYCRWVRILPGIGHGKKFLSKGREFLAFMKTLRFYRWG